MKRKTIICALFLGITSVILGAFASHGLKKIISPEAIHSFEIGVRYQMYHALFLLFVGLSGLSQVQKKWILGLTLTGILFFSGTIYGLATNSVSSFFDFTKIALITPMGGFLLIFAWTLTIILYFRQKK